MDVARTLISTAVLIWRIRVPTLHSLHIVQSQLSPGCHMAGMYLTLFTYYLCSVLILGYCKLSP